MFRMYPKLIGKQVQVFVEANLSHDLAAYIEREVKQFYAQSKHGFLVKFVKQYDSRGKLLPGVLTRHKANLVSYFKRVLDEEKIFVCQRPSTVSKVLEMKYGDKEMRNRCIGQSDFFPTDIEASTVLKTLADQASLFRCYRRQNTTIYSGKRTRINGHVVDDMLMALITAVAWARLPENTYMTD